MTRRPATPQPNPVTGALGLFAVAFVVWRWLMIAVLVALQAMWRAWLWWLHQLTTASARNPEAVRRRRPWIILGTLAVPALATLVAWPAAAARVGWLPAAGAVALPASVIMLTRRTATHRARRRARNQPPPPDWQQTSIIHAGDWASSPRTAALERLIGELIINLSDQGLTVDTTIAAAVECSILSRSLLLAGIEANLTTLAQAEQDQTTSDRHLTPVGAAAIPWLFELHTRLRPLVGSGVGHVTDVVDRQGRAR